MKLHYSESDNGIRVIKLTGRLDHVGHGQIENEFSAHCDGDGTRVLVDMSGVDFLASIGIHLLKDNAKSLSLRNGKMVLFNPTEDVLNILEMTGIPSIIPIYSSLESAEAVLLAHI